jgi:hypothetical protein
VRYGDFYFKQQRWPPHGFDRVQVDRWMIAERRMAARQNVVHSAKIASLAKRDIPLLV